MVKKILWISDFTDTGYTNATICLLKYLIRKVEKYDIYLFAINHFLVEKDFKENCEKIFPEFPYEKIRTINNKAFYLNYKDPKTWMKEPYAKEMIMMQRFGGYELMDVLEEIKPDLVLSINDNSALEVHLKILKKYEKDNKISIKKVFYIPIDCYNLPPEFFKELEDVDYLMTMTEMSCSEILKTGYKGSVDVLAHSINTEVFHIIEDKIMIKNKWIPEEHRSKFLILNSNKNQDRKRLDITINSFKLLMEREENRDKYCLILKTSKKPSFNNGGILLEEYIEKLPEYVSKNIIVIEKRLTLEELNELYNCVDVNINSSIGEGWGIIPCEVSLCGVAQLVPDSTSYPEIFFKECLIRTVEMPRLLCFSGGRINPESVQCICRGYRQYIEGEYKSLKMNVINPLDVESFLVSEMGNDENPRCSASIKENLRIVCCFRTIGGCINYINRNKIDVFQIFVHNGYNLSKIEEVMKEMDIKRLEKGYKLEYLDIGVIYAGKVMVKVPIMENIVEMIERLRREPRRREMIGKMCERTIRERYDIETVGEKIEGLMDKYLE